jgi:hypothetical protein
MAALQLLSGVPVVSTVAVGGLLVASLGAVVVTYGGFKEFTPVAFPEEVETA